MDMQYTLSSESQEVLNEWLAPNCFLRLLTVGFHEVCWLPDSLFTFLIFQPIDEPCLCRSPNMRQNTLHRTRSYDILLFSRPEYPHIRTIFTADEGGATSMSGGIAWLTLPAGYLGSSFIGACLIACGFNTNASKIATIVLAVFFLFTLWWARKNWLWVFIHFF